MIDDPHGPLYTVVCTDTNPYAIWQVEFLEHTWLRSGMPGELVWLVGAPDGADLPRGRHARVFATSAPNTHPRLAEPYPPINRLFSIEAWLERERPVGSVLFIDCDMVFRDRFDRVAEAGAPVGQHWWDFALGERWTSAVDTVSPGIAAHMQPVTWPMLIHTSDLRQLMRRWIDLTVRLRNLTGAWESDMVAFAIVLAERSMHCRLEMWAAWMPWPDDVVGDAPLLHYCQPVLDAHGEVVWYKQTYTPWAPIGSGADIAALGYCRELLTMLDRYADIRRRADAYQAG